jgi:hypothetical protein
MLLDFNYRLRLSGTHRLAFCSLFIWLDGFCCVSRNMFPSCAVRIATLALSLAIVVSSSASAGLPGQSGALQEGVYARVDPYTREIVELRNGRFRYWFSSDAISDSDPHYPLSGRYSLSEDSVVLNHAQVDHPQFRFRMFNGVATLWNKTALDYWRDQPKKKQFCTLFKQAYTPEEIWRSDFHRRLKWND